jgi:hypothetical protein
VTPLQVQLAAAFNVLDYARSKLDDDAYTVFVGILLERLQIEAARLVVGEALRATRRAAEGES